MPWKRASLNALAILLILQSTTGINPASGVILNDFVIEEAPLDIEQAGVIIHKLEKPYHRNWQSQSARRGENYDAQILLDQVDDFARLRRNAPPAYKPPIRGRYRGLTQSQYLNIGDSSPPGKAEAESGPDGSRAVVSGNRGMGQAQSQSGFSSGCEGCDTQSQGLSYGRDYSNIGGVDGQPRGYLRVPGSYGEQNYPRPDSGPRGPTAGRGPQLSSEAGSGEQRIPGSTRPSGYPSSGLETPGRGISKLYPEEGRGTDFDSQTRLSVGPSPGKVPERYPQVGVGIQGGNSRAEGIDSDQFYLGGPVISKYRPELNGGDGTHPGIYIPGRPSGRPEISTHREDGTPPSSYTPSRQERPSGRPGANIDRDHTGKLPGRLGGPSPGKNINGEEGAHPGAYIPDGRPGISPHGEDDTLPGTYIPGRQERPGGRPGANINGVDYTSKIPGKQGRPSSEKNIYDGTHPDAYIPGGRPGTISHGEDDTLPDTYITGPGINIHRGDGPLPGSYSPDRPRPREPNERPGINTHGGEGALPGTYQVPGGTYVIDKPRGPGDEFHPASYYGSERQDELSESSKEDSRRPGKYTPGRQGGPGTPSVNANEDDYRPGIYSPTGQGRPGEISEYNAKHDIHHGSYIPDRQKGPGTRPGETHTRFENIRPGALIPGDPRETGDRSGENIYDGGHPPGHYTSGGASYRPGIYSPDEQRLPNVQSNNYGRDDFRPSYGPGGQRQPSTRPGSIKYEDDYVPSSVYTAGEQERPGGRPRVDSYGRDDLLPGRYTPGNQGGLNEGGGFVGGKRPGSYTPSGQKRPGDRIKENYGGGDGTSTFSGQEGSGFRPGVNIYEEGHHPGPYTPGSFERPGDRTETNVYGRDGLRPGVYGPERQEGSGGKPKDTSYGRDGFRPGGLSEGYQGSLPEISKPGVHDQRPELYPQGGGDRSPGTYTQRTPYDGYFETRPASQVNNGRGYEDSDQDVYSHRGRVEIPSSFPGSQNYGLRKPENNQYSPRHETTGLYQKPGFYNQGNNAPTSNSYDKDSNYNEEDPETNIRLQGGEYPNGRGNYNKFVPGTASGDITGSKLYPEVPGSYPSEYGSGSYPSEDRYSGNRGSYPSSSKPSKGSTDIGVTGRDDTSRYSDNQPTYNNNRQPTDRDYQYSGKNGVSQTGETNPDNDDSNSQAETSIQQIQNGTQASASSVGTHNGGTAQSQISGSYTGSGSFSAQAQTIDLNRGAQTQISVGKDGATSSAQGKGGQGQSQAQLQLGSEDGATLAEAQSGGWNHGTNTQVQASSKGGLADAQANGPGSTSSQAQIGFQPHTEGKEDDDKSNNPFYGGGTASAQSGTYAGQSQTQIQGKFKYGISYNGAAQAGSGGKDVLSKNKTMIKPFDVFSAKTVRNDRQISLNSGFKSTSTTEKNIEESMQESETKNVGQKHVNHNFSTINTTEKNYVISDDTDETDVKDVQNVEDYDDFEEDEYDGDFYPNTESTQQRMKVKNFPQESFVRQSGNNQKQHILLGPYDKSGIHIVKDSSSSDTLKEGMTFQPGEIIPGTQGYTIPIGFRGRVRAVSHGDETFAVAGENGESQAQSVSLTPSTGNITNGKSSKSQPMTRSRKINSQISRSLPVGDRPNSNNLKEIESSINKSPDSFITVTKSVTGALNNNGNTEDKKFSHTYYTKSSTCGYFTFTCNLVYGSNGRTKICKPNIPKNPDGSPVQC